MENKASGEGDLFAVVVNVPSSVVWPDGRTLTRSEYTALAYGQLMEHGCLGVHEGTMMTDEAYEKGFATNAWVLDAGLPPERRDWVEQKDWCEVSFYFSDREIAELVAGKLGALRVDAIESKNWNEEWQRSFQGIVLRPFMEIRPPWHKFLHSELLPLVIEPGTGFGTGTHETTQLCIEAIAESRSRLSLDSTWLDFGAGSGILALAALRLGFQRAVGVEIDPLAHDNFRENAKSNGLAADLYFSLQELPVDGFDAVVANILKPVLLEHAQAIAALFVKRPLRALILSGLVEEDVAEVQQCYEALLGSRFGVRCKVQRNGEWRSLVWVK